MENKKQKSTGRTIVIIILVVLLICSLGYIAYDKYLYKLLKKDNNVTEEKTNKEEKLDVNSRLVQNLYHKVSTGEMSKEDATSSFNWIYSSENFYVNKASQSEKMVLLNILLNSNKGKIYTGDNNLIPDTFNDDQYGFFESALSSKEFGMDETYYNRKYIELLYKDLYGSEAQLDTSASILTSNIGITLYRYISDIDKYVLYVKAGGATGLPIGAYGTLIKATKNGNELKIYEKVTKIYLDDFSVEDNGKTTSYKKDEVVSEENYIYTFKLEDDGMYSFYSRVKES